MDILDKLEKYTEKSDLCWEWKGEKNAYGYGRIRIAGKYTQVSRLVMSVIVLNFNPIPKGMLVCHRCDNPSCVRPDHLFLGTPSDNAKDAYHKGRLNILNASKGTRFKKPL
jgi:hypothetical protein